MPILHEMTFDVNRGQLDQFKQWLLDHEEELADAYPDGIEYMGTYANIYGGHDAGEFKTLLRVEEYAALDRLAERMAEEGVLGRLLWEVSAFTTGGVSSRATQSLWKKVTRAVATGD